MIDKVTKADVLTLVGQVVIGILSNPANSGMVYDQYQRQQTIQNAVNDVQNAFLNQGIAILEKDEI